MHRLAKVTASLIVGMAMVPLPSEGQEARKVDAKNMELRQLILAGHEDEANRLAQALGPGAGDVLLETSSSPKASTRLLVLRLASTNPSPASCRAVLGRLSDSNATVRSFAGGLIRLCQYRENAPDLVRVLNEQKDPSFRSALVGQLGTTGGPEQLPTLQKLLEDPDVSESASLALVQLGDPNERQKLIRRLQDPDAQVRITALRACMTIRDRKLAAWFGPALDDSRDAVSITRPHQQPTVFARVCDYAVMTMAQLGYRFSFPVEFLERRPPEQIQEAKHFVEAMTQEREAR